ncbi:MAG: DUF814 domain-containing protein [Planctomycetes bacterium]|nr:DUF814 domain-containing protein [Planctomycetota bacterium]
MDLQRAGRARLNLDAAQVAALAREIQTLARGARLKELVALPPADVVLVLEQDGERGVRRVRLSADPEAPRLHAQHERTERHDGPLGPFFRRLAAELVGATFVECTPVAGDRIALVEWRDTPVGERRALVLELFGRHANLVLLGRGDLVLDLLVPPPEGKRDARLVVGKAWSAPAKASRSGGRAATPPSGDPAKVGSPTLAGPDAAPTAPADPWLALRALAPARETAAPLSWLVEAALGAQAREARTARETKRVAERLARKLERARSLVRGLEQRLGASRDFERVREEGELLKAHLHELARGMTSIEVDDFFAGDGAKRRIALEAKLSPHENLERFFDRAKKLERALQAVDAELALARGKVAALEALEARLADADPASVEADAVERGLLEPAQTAVPADRKPKAPAPRVPYKSFQGARGSEIRVGRNAKDNDALTFKHARGNDLWLHTADTPGSHVVLRIDERGKEPDPDELVDAAHLAVHFSPLRGAGRARVHVARQKEVHKPRGAKAGLVTLSGGKILELRLQPERLQRLLGSHRPPGGSESE